MKIVFVILWAVVLLWDAGTIVGFYLRDPKTYTDLLVATFAMAIPTWLVLWLYCHWQKATARSVERELGIKPPRGHSGDFLKISATAFFGGFAVAAMLAGICWIFWEFKRPFMYCSFFCIPCAFWGEIRGLLRRHTFIDKDIAKLPSFANWQRICEQRRYASKKTLADIV